MLRSQVQILVTAIIEVLMKNFLFLVVVALGTLVSFSLPASPKIIAYQRGDGVFRDEQSGIVLPLPKTIKLLAEESDLNEDDGGGRWMLFNDGSNDDIALIIYRLERPLSAEEFFFDYLLKEMDEAPSTNVHILFGRPSMQRLLKNKHVVAKIQYPLMSSHSDFLNADYFFTHGQYGFKIWLSSEVNDLQALEKLEAQIELALDSMEFKK